MYKISNLQENPNIKVISSLGNVRVLEYQRDMSVTPLTAATEYFSAQMDIRKRQAVIELDDSGFVLQAGSMQWIAGDIKIGTGIKGVGDFFGKALSSSVTKESTIKPLYRGTGTIVLEPTYRYIILLDVTEWGTVVLDDGLFLACDENVKQHVTSRTTLSSAVLGKEGLFNLALSGSGVAVLESPVPYEELVKVELNNDVLKIDGNNAIAWSNSLQFTVEKTTKSLIGSAASGEGFVNVYRGTGTVLMAPLTTSANGK